MIVAIIPARFASTRFPGKPLVDIMGKSMIQRVYEQTQKATLIDKVVIATDDERIAEHANTFNAEVVMTSPNHPSGTDRCWEALNKLDTKFDYVINVQGDEPFIDPRQIDTLAEVLQNKTTELATLIAKVNRPDILTDIGEVKVVINSLNEALYFSRQPIPYLREVPPADWSTHHQYYNHVGMYAYRTDILKKITRLPVSSLEKAESLEQLRWLENGFSIKCALTDIDSYCIETPEDIAKVLRIIADK
jgi:3-deoxy-manno-octulosonate cytidylyltransferase (CMP-KDO synthetase)